MEAEAATRVASSPRLFLEITPHPRNTATCLCHGSPAQQHPLLRFWLWLVLDECRPVDINQHDATVLQRSDAAPHSNGGLPTRSESSPIPRTCLSRDCPVALGAGATAATGRSKWWVRPPPVDLGCGFRLDCGRGSHNDDYPKPEEYRRFVPWIASECNRPSTAEYGAAFGKSAEPASSHPFGKRAACRPTVEDPGYLKEFPRVPEPPDSGRRRAFPDNPVYPIRYLPRRRKLLRPPPDFRRGGWLFAPDVHRKAVPNGTHARLGTLGH